MENIDRIEITSEPALWDWLTAHHAQAESVLLVTWKVVHTDKYVGREAVLDALIAHGWIDGRRFKLDADRTMQLIAPRRQQIWAKTYKVRAARLEAEGRMQDAGRAAIAAARASGLWDAMTKVDALEVPADLAELLARGGGEWFEGAAASYRRNVLRWIAGAKTPATRAKRIGIVASHAAAGKKVPQY